MGNLIQEVALPLVVYGQQQYSYTVDGVARCDYGLAVCTAALRQASSIEDVAAGVTAAVRQRQRKLQVLGAGLSKIAAANATFKGDAASDSESSPIAGLGAAMEAMKQYGVNISHNGDKLTRKNAQLAQTDVEYAIDTENNDLRQDTTALQGLISKRDNAFSSASTLLKKYDNAAKTIIRGMNS